MEPFFSTTHLSRLGSDTGGLHTFHIIDTCTCHTVTLSVNDESMGTITALVHQKLTNDALPRSKVGEDLCALLAGMPSLSDSQLKAQSATLCSLACTYISDVS